MLISLPLFILIYVCLLCFLPFLLVVFCLKSAKKHIFYTKYIIIVWSFIYSLFVFMLTLTSVQIVDNYISFSLPNSASYFFANYSFALTAYNFIINFALCLPLGFIVFSAITINNALNNNYCFPFTKKVFLIGIILGTLIETLQAILPINRVVDICDIIFDGISTLIAFNIAYIYFSLVKPPAHIYK